MTSARAAFEGFSKTPGHVRARYLYAIARCIQKHHRLFAVLGTVLACELSAIVGKEKLDEESAKFYVACLSRARGRYDTLLRRYVT